MRGGPPVLLAVLVCLQMSGIMGQATTYQKLDFSAAVTACKTKEGGTTGAADLGAVCFACVNAEWEKAVTGRCKAATSVKTAEESTACNVSPATNSAGAPCQATTDLKLEWRKDYYAEAAKCTTSCPSASCGTSLPIKCRTGTDFVPKGVPAGSSTCSPKSPSDCSKCLYDAHIIAIRKEYTEQLSDSKTDKLTQYLPSLFDALTKTHVCSTTSKQKLIEAMGKPATATNGCNAQNASDVLSALVNCDTLDTAAVELRLPVCSPTGNSSSNSSTTCAKCVANNFKSAVDTACSIKSATPALASRTTNELKRCAEAEPKLYCGEDVAKTLIWKNEYNIAIAKCTDATTAEKQKPAYCESGNVNANTTPKGGNSLKSGGAFSVVVCCVLAAVLSY